MEFNPAVLQHIHSKIWTTGFDSFICPEGVNPLLFSQLCIFHYTEIQKNQTLGTTFEVMSQQIKHIKFPKTGALSKRRPMKL